MKASELLLQSAEPFDKACMMVREMELEIERLRTLATEALELTKYAAAAFAYTEAGSGTPEWFEGLHEQLETLQPKLMDVMTPNVIYTPEYTTRTGEIEMKDLLEAISENQMLLEVGKLAIEDSLIAYRNSGLSQPMRANGLVVRETDGSSSSVIRFGPETALQIGLKAIARHLAEMISLTSLRRSENVSTVGTGSDNKRVWVGR